MKLENHTLYYKSSCPYCVKVLRFAEANGLEFDLASTYEPENAARLIEIGGKRQVPCMVINGEAMYESADIVAYLASKIS